MQHMTEVMCVLLYIPILYEVKSDIFVLLVCTQGQNVGTPVKILHFETNTSANNNIRHLYYIHKKLLK